MTFYCRLRQGKEQDRDATLAALVCRTFRDHTMIFVRTKADAHRVKILLGLFGLKVKTLNIRYFFILFYNSNLNLGWRITWKLISTSKIGSFTYV